MTISSDRELLFNVIYTFSRLEVNLEILIASALELRVGSITPLSIAEKAQHLEYAVTKRYGKDVPVTFEKLKERILELYALRDEVVDKARVVDSDAAEDYSEQITLVITHLYAAIG
jgi:hypothetical protein